VVLARFVGKRVMGIESGGFHWHHNSSNGKTKGLLSPCASVFGDPAAQIISWCSTDNGLEGRCELSNDMSLFLDELNQAEPRAVQQVIYMLGGDGQAARGA
jgi:putative DNA primase/helicase